MRGALIVLVGLGGCLPASPEGASTMGPQAAPYPGLLRSPPAADPAPSGNAWADCYRRFQPGDDPSEDLARLGAACVKPAGLRPVGDVYRGAEQGAGDPPERLVFRMRRACYRAIAVGGEGVTDLDLAVYDPRGRLVAGDVSRDPWPVVPPRGPLCVDEGGVYTVLVSVARGHGAYFLQIWGSPRPELPE